MVYLPYQLVQDFFHQQYQVHEMHVYLPHGFHVFLPWHIWHGHHLKGGLKPKGKPLSTLSTGGKSADFKCPPQKRSLGLGIE